MKALLLFAALFLPAQEAEVEDPLAERALEATAALEAGEFVLAAEAYLNIASDRAAILGAAHPLVARAHHNAAIALWRGGDTDAALARALHALELLLVDSGGEATPGVALERRTIAEIAEASGDLKLARDYADTACTDFEAVYGRTPMTAEVRELSGRLAFRERDLAAAEEHFHWALAIQERFGATSSPRLAVRPLVGLASVLAARGRVDPALALFEHAAASLASDPEATAERSAALGAALDLYEALGEYGLAAGVQERLLTLLPPLNKTGGAGDPQAARAYLGAAFTFLRLGAPERALDLAVMLAPSVTGADLADRLIWSSVQGEAELDLGNAESALARAERDLAAIGESSAELGAGLVWGVAGLRARASLATGRLDAAREDFVRLFDERRAQIGEDHPALLDTFEGLLAIELAGGKVTPELIDLLDMFQAASRSLRPERFAHRALTGDGWRSWAEGQLLLARERSGSRGAAFAALDRERERAASVPLAAWMERGALEDSPIAADTRAALLRDELFGWSVDDRKELEATLDRAARELARSPWGDYLAPEGADLESTRTFLAPGDARLLTYVETRDSIWLWLVAPIAEGDRIVRVGSRAGVTKLLARAQAGLRATHVAWEGTALFERLLEPVEEELAGIAQVYVVADGDLAYFPFEALPAPGDRERFFAERSRLVYAPSVKSLIDGGPGSVENTPAAEGPSSSCVRRSAAQPLDPALSPLGRLRSRFGVHPEDGPSSAEGEVFGADEKLLAGDAARESRLRAESFDGQRFLRLDLDGYVDTEVPGCTGLLLTAEEADGRAAWQRENGFLELHEIAGLSLGVETLLLPRLETGPDPTRSGARAEAIGGLVRACAQAGAQRVVATGWTVPGRAAANFDALLARHLRSGDPALAGGAPLAAAQREWLARAEGAARHPGLWARYRSFLK